MPVNNFSCSQADVVAPHPELLGTPRKGTLEPDRPLSEYDNIAPAASAQSYFPLGDITFRFDDSLSKSGSMSSTAVSYINEDKQTTALPQHQYENVLETLQLRNKRESDQQVSPNQHDNQPSPPRSVMSDAKSLFFGLDRQKHSMDDDHQYINLMPEEPKIVSANSDKVSATSSASGSSSTTATPSASPTRQNESGNQRKYSEGSVRSKSPKFMLPEAVPVSPSQSVYMSTTVPQNIKGQNIMGRHKPTRHSLRHSRMIVTTKHLQGPASSNALNIRYIWLAKFVLSCKILIGISLLTLGGWICLFANSTPIQQNPFWSGIIIIISGLLGLYLLTFKRTRSKLKANFFWFLKMNACVIIILTVFLTTLAFIYASFHYMSLTSDHKKCFPENVFVNSSSCICVFNIKSEINSLNDSVEGKLDSSGHIDLPEGGNIVHFRDLSCNELSTWTHILLTSMILNFIGLLLAVCYMTQFIFGCKRKRSRTYASVRNSA